MKILRTANLGSNFTGSYKKDCNYADDTTPYLVPKNTAEVLENLTNITHRLITYFANNHMKANHGKCHLLLSTQHGNIQIANTTINCSRSQKLLGIVFNNKLKFDKHIENICQKTNRKLNALLARVTNYVELPKRRILMNAFFKAQLNYYSVVWMFHSRCFFFFFFFFE